ncbi:hypothetical protein BDZ89DRAFT_650232 [Hymenopellis radicata]|nr:hypothetical protein BDZ89DRAFT_650232 [Hymenopellis radicata]
MALHPEKKFSWFKEHWDEALAASAMTVVRDLFKEYYAKVHGSMDTPSAAQVQVASTSKQSEKHRKFLLDDDDDVPVTPATSSSLPPWEVDFNAYIDTKHSLETSSTSGGLKKESVVTWWGVGFSSPIRVLVLTFV